MDTDKELVGKRLCSSTKLPRDWELIIVVIEKRLINPSFD